MEDGGTVTPQTSGSDITSEKMVAPSTSNAARRAMLEERKRDIEAMLAKYHLELKKLCIQEAELTGVMPQEMPVEIGEIPPTIRRKVGTAYQLNEKLLNLSIKESSREQLIADLELRIQVHINLMNAALGLSMEGNISKTVKRQHAKEYIKYKEQVRQLEEQLIQLKEKAALEVKQKKKSRVPEPHDDAVSVDESEQCQTQSPMDQHFQQMRQPHLTRLSPAETYPEARYQNNTHMFHRSRENHIPNSLFPRPEFVNSGNSIYQLNNTDLMTYFGRHDNMPENVYRGSLQLPHSVSPGYTEQYYTQPTNRHMPVLGHPILARNQYSPYYNEPNQSQDYRLSANPDDYSPTASISGLTSRQSSGSQHSPLAQTCNLSLNTTPRHSRVLPSGAIDPGKLVHLYPHPENMQGPGLHYPHYQVDEGITDYRNNRINPHNQTEPTFGTPRNTNTFDRHSNLVTIQPHQQYENNGMSDIHGRLEASSIAGTLWTSQCDKRFGSLDRRRAITKKEVFDEITNQARPDEENGFRKPVLHPLKRHIDGRALVRTQSLGSVGLNTENIYHPSDDTVSSCDGERRPRPILKRKEKDWVETSLDGPLNECQPLSRSQSTVPPTFLPDQAFTAMRTSPEHSADSPCSNEKFQVNNYGYRHSPVSPKPLLEIPAESNPSPRVSEQLNIEMLNNNIPKNCMMVQQGIIKPYHEETKPFEMSDFYKYSTKFKKSPQKEATERSSNLSLSPRGAACSRNLTGNWQSWETSQNGVPDSPNDNITLDSHRRMSSSLNSSEDQRYAEVPTVSQRYPGDINNWLQHQENNNRPSQSGNRSSSNATLV
ncbi:uncharacterized protein LOC126748903 [Anthonomus grandis grandis]|uniref:uncharacterized protein LOC126748903 n=1 Tax=Anthonomus grandis grandis TaxID=2921223 RepID=UPI00216519D0|nr:uncharacterized protein LOC126748903 [Anthonomus grandis grandis]